MVPSCAKERDSTLHHSDTFFFHRPDRQSLGRWLLHLAAASLACLMVACGGGAGTGTRWVSAWTAAPTGPADLAVAADLAGAFAFENQSLRMVVRSSVGGEAVRVRLSNEIGDAPAPVEIGTARVALRSAGSAAVAGSSRALTFNGQPSVVIPPKGWVLSDPVVLSVPAQADLLVSLYLPHATTVQTFHPVSRQTHYLSPPGDHTDAVDMPAAATVSYWYVLSGVEVRRNDPASALVAFGDSITDGYGDPQDRMDAPAPWPSWPSRLADRLQGQGAAPVLSVVNAGLAGNRLLSDAALALPVSLESLLGYVSAGPRGLTRFQRDVLDQKGASCVVILLGINDIGDGPAIGKIVTPEQIIAGYRTLIDRAHGASMAVIGATLPPFSGYASPYFSADNEAKRQAVNAWIRTSGAYDAVVDFDAALRDPASPDRLQPSLDSGDHLHPSDAGYSAMANAFDLTVVRRLCAR